MEEGEKKRKNIPSWVDPEGLFLHKFEDDPDLIQKKTFYWQRDTVKHSFAQYVNIGKKCEHTIYTSHTDPTT